MLIDKERAWNNLNNDGAGFLFLTKPSQEAHSGSTQRLRWFRQEQKDQPECSCYFMHVPKEWKFNNLEMMAQYFCLHSRCDNKRMAGYVTIATTKKASYKANQNIQVIVFHS